MDNSRICHHCCSMSVVSITSCSHFFGQWSYWGYTHGFTKFHTEVMSWISRAYGCRLCMDLPEVPWRCDLYCLWTACPCLPWSAVAMRALTWVVFVPWASFTPMLRSGSSISHAQKLPHLHEIFKHAHSVYGLKHTHNFCQCSHASVGLAQARPNEAHIGHFFLQCQCHCQFWKSFNPVHI